MIGQIDGNNLPHVAGAIVVAIIGVIYGLQKLPNRWKESKVESSLLEMMHQELERLSAQNTILTTELSKLQLEVLKLTKELNSLTLENEHLKEEINLFSKQIERLQSTLKAGENNVG